MSEPPSTAWGTAAARVRARARNEFQEIFIIVKDTFTHLVTREGVILMTAVVGIVIWGPKGRPIFQDLLGGWLRSFQDQSLWAEQLLSFGTGFVLLVVVPLLVIRFRFREPFSNFGLGLGDPKLGLALTLVLIVASLPLFSLGSGDASMQWEYPMLYRGLDASARKLVFSWDRFLLYEAVYVSFFFIIEFIFRGYLLFGLRDRFGRYAILFQMLSYTAWHLVKPVPELAGTILWGFATAAVTLRARSMWYVFIAHWLLNVFIDMLILYRQGVL